jgi:endonuclease/exonuclease/phosphatase family metal-dependent hydrolase
MKYQFQLLPALATALVTLAWTTQAALAEPVEVMTFNLRYAHPAPNSWAERRPVVRALLELERPDLIGTQEGLHAQITDLEQDLPDHDWVGVGRDGGQDGEYMAIFYRRNRFHPVEHGHFWLSDTPEVAGSRSWGNRFARMVTWARLRGPGKCELYVVNTHFDHEVQSAREKSAELLLQRIRQFDHGLPVVLLGDFNAPAGVNPVYRRLTSPDALVDTWRELRKPEPAFGTFHDFKGEVGAQDTARIDWILVRGRARAISTRILTYARNKQYPSDHFPVAAEIEVGNCR